MTATPPPSPHAAAPLRQETTMSDQTAGRCGVDYHCPNGQHTAADLTPAQAARLEAIEAAPWAEEALQERLSVALYEADGGEGFAHPVLARAAQQRYRRLAVAAIDVMRGATDDGAVGRVLALADAWETEAARHRDAEPVSTDGLLRAITAERHCRTMAAQLRAAVGAPATAEGDDDAS